MKNYNEMAESVLKRRDKYIVERREQMKKVSSILSCVCLVALLGIGTRVIPKQEPLDSGDVNYDGNYYSTDDYSKKEQAEEKENSILLISSYESVGEPCYKAPCDGNVYMSIPLSRAIETYGDNAHYHVLVQVFKDSFPLASESAEVQAEMDRLTSLGYPIVFENGTSYAFSLKASEEQLQSISSGENYGYMLFLYGEFFDGLNDEVSETDSAASE